VDNRHFRHLGTDSYFIWQWATTEEEGEAIEIEMLYSKIERKIAEKGYVAGLAEIKSITRGIMKKYKGEKRSRKKRIYLNFLASLTQEIHDKMNTVDKDKKFPVKHQQVRRTHARKVIANG